MQIGIISDTHRDILSIHQAVRALEDMDLIIHLGDNVQDVEEIKKIYKNEVISVKGNCDFTSKCSDEVIREIGGVKFLITHGHKYDVKYSIMRLKYRAEELGAQVALFGHTHTSVIEYDNGILFMNPGSASLPRDMIKSVGIIRINGENALGEIKIL